MSATNAQWEACLKKKSWATLRRLAREGSMDQRTVWCVKAAKWGSRKALEILAKEGSPFPAASVFEAALTSYRTVTKTAEHFEILKMAYHSGLSVRSRIGWMRQPLLCECAMYGQGEIVSYILAREQPKNAYSRIAIGDLPFAEKHRRDGTLKALDENGFTCLHYCASSALHGGEPEWMKRMARICALLLRAGVDPCLGVSKELVLTPLFLCAWFGGNEAILEQLVRAGADPSAGGMKALEFALEPHQRSGAPYYRIAEKLLELGADINAQTGIQGRTLLHGAAHRGTIQPVRWLLEHQANPHAMNDEGQTPLHLAAERNTSTQVIELLLERGAKVNAKDRAGRTPLQYARAKKRTKVEMALRQAGAR